MLYKSEPLKIISSLYHIFLFTVVEMVTARRYFVTQHFDGEPKRGDFKLVEYELPPLTKGDILVKVEWVSVDPYDIRAHNKSYIVPYKEFGYQIGIVQESKHPDYPVGTRIVSHQSWCDYYVMNPDINEGQNNFGHYKLPNLQGLPISYGIGALGIPGATAYFGLLEVCKPKARETIVVTTAAGAIGSIVGQIAKLKGCRVIGFTSDDNKTKWLVDELGFDEVFNYRKVDVTSVLQEAAPEGVDCYFDNVGGDLSYLIMNQMNCYGRVAICGSASCYSDGPSEITKMAILQSVILAKQLTVQGFNAFRWVDQWSEAFTQLIKWIKSGELKVDEQVTEGLDNVFDAFQGMLCGKHLEKAVVKV